jgi:hypothetical protein
MEYEFSVVGTRGYEVFYRFKFSPSIPDTPAIIEAALEVGQLGGDTTDFLIFARSFFRNEGIGLDDQIPF